MFKNLSNRLSRSLRNLSGRGRLTENNIKDTLRDVRKTMLEADVSLVVVNDFISQVKQNALAPGKDINNSLTPGQEFIKIVHTELVKIMGEQNNYLNLRTKSPAVVLITGLPGTGKTTCVGKLGKYLNEQNKKKVLVVSTDIYRPAAIKQLEYFVKNICVDFFPSHQDQKPLDIIKHAVKHAKIKFYDVLLVDTAGRLHTDKVMMEELSSLYSAIKPVEILFLVDAMTGQDALNSAKIFNQTIPITGIILTKVDGDARGGAALSIRYITGIPIKFMSIGEKIEDLEQFYPKRLVDRILGMGDVLSLIEEIEKKTDSANSELLKRKLKSGQDFDLMDFMSQLKTIRKLGGLSSIINKLPINQLPDPDSVNLQIDDKVLIRMEAIINSMTIKERANPSIIKGSRKRRISAGSGIDVQEINKLLKQFEEMQHMVKKIQTNGMSKMMNNFKNIFLAKKTSR